MNCSDITPSPAIRLPTSISPTKSFPLQTNNGGRVFTKDTNKATEKKTCWGLLKKIQTLWEGFVYLLRTLFSSGRKKGENNEPPTRVDPRNSDIAKCKKELSCQNTALSNLKLPKDNSNQEVDPNILEVVTKIKELTLDLLVLEKGHETEKRIWIKETPNMSYTTQGKYVEHSAAGFRYTDERQKLHHSISVSIIEKKLHENTKTLKAIIIMGGVGAGKGKYIAGIPNKDDFINISPDIVMQELPEYRQAINLGMRNGKQITARNAAAICHDEAVDITEKLKDMIIASGQNFILESCGVDRKSLEALTGKVKEKCYEVTLVMIDNEVNTAQKRAHERAETTGRYVPEENLRATYINTPRNFMALFDKANKAILLDNRGPAPEVVWSKQGEKIEVANPIFLATPLYRSLPRTKGQKHRCPYALDLLARIESRQKRDRDAAISNLKRGEVKDPEELLDTICEKFASAPMTTNVNPLNLFDEIGKNNGLLQYFQFPEKAEADPTHAAFRDRIERALFGIDNEVIRIFDKEDHLINHVATDTLNLKGYRLQRIMEEVDNRPIYAGLNFLGKEEGAAFGYCHTVVILHNRLKNLTTLLGIDSFDKPAGGTLHNPERLGSFNNIFPIINDLITQEQGTKKLKRLINAITLNDPKEFPDYIECHIHSEVTWDMVKEIHVDADDILDGNLPDGTPIKTLDIESKKFIIERIYNNALEFQILTNVPLFFNHFDKYIQTTPSAQEKNL